MRIRSALGTLAIVSSLSLVTGAAALPQQPAPAADREAADHDAIRALKGMYEQAIRENRVDLLAPHLHRDFHGVMVTGQPVNSFTDLQRYWSTIKGLIGNGGTYTTTLNPERSVIIGDVALARGTSNDIVRTGDGTEFRFMTLWSAMLQRDDGAWKLRYVQGTMDPVGNPFVREFAKRALIRTAALSLLGGLVVGISFGIVWQKRRARRA